MLCWLSINLALLLVLELTATVKDPQLVAEAQTLKTEEPLVIPRRVNVLPERLACTMLGFEFEAT